MSITKFSCWDERRRQGACAVKSCCVYWWFTLQPNSKCENGGPCSDLNLDLVKRVWIDTERNLNAGYYFVWIR